MVWEKEGWEEPQINERLDGTERMWGYKREKI